MMTRTEYNRTRDRILANAQYTDRQRRSKLRVLDIAAGEELSKEDKEAWEAETKKDVNKDLESYKSILYVYHPEFEKHPNRFDLLVLSDPEESYVITYTMGDVLGTMYKQLSEDNKYDLQDWDQYGMEKATGVFLDEQHQVIRSDINRKYLGTLTANDFDGLKKKLKLQDIVIESSTNLFNEIDDIVDAAYSKYKNNIIVA
jgi:hypothetical protein